MFLADIQFNRINENKVEEYLNRQIENDVQTFSDVKPTLKPSNSTEGFSFHECEYVVRDSLSKVWKHYVNTDPSKAWDTRKMNFGMLFCRSKNNIFYPNEVVSKIEKGQVIYLNLNLLKGIKKLCTAFEIMDVNSENAIVEFSYVEDNLTHGKQQMHFFETAKGHTKIVHRSFFRSKSKLRDHFLYPYFHTRLTNNYHRNMKRMYKESY